MLRSLLFLLVVSLACSTQNESYEEPIPAQEVWVCYNPWTESHGKLCNSECLDSGATNRFCWLLHRTDCDNGLERTWQLENCHLFDEGSSHAP